MTEVRLAVDADVASIVRMAQRFAESPVYRQHIRLDVGRVQRLTERLIAMEDGVVFVAIEHGLAVGMIAMWLFDHPMADERMAQELVWWVDPKHKGSGVQLLRKAEAWALAHGAQAIEMTAPTRRLGEFYEAIGYAAVEVRYLKRVAA